MVGTQGVVEATMTSGVSLAEGRGEGGLLETELQAWGQCPLHLGQ